MLLRHLIHLVIPASLTFACAHSPAAPPLVPATAASSDYRTIQPEVSLSRTAQDAELKQASVDPDADADADVMSEILAIPPGG